MGLRSENPTMPCGERSWFVKREPSGAIAWAMVRPFDDGSAVFRTADDLRTCAPPNGPIEALRLVQAGGFVELSLARVRGVVPADVEPPLW